MAWLKNRALDELTTAINLGETEKALSLIKPELPLDAVAKGQHSSPLFAAIGAANTTIVEALLAAGASVTLANEMGETPLHAAASKGDEALVRTLIDRGAAVNARIVRKRHQYDGRTPLMDAAAANNLAVVKALLEHGADAFAKDTSGMTALSIAEFFGKRVANHLRKVMNRSPATSDLGIHDAAGAGLIDRVQALLAKGTPIDESDETGRTPLHHAVMGGQTEVVRLLLDRGAAVDVQDRRDFRPLLLADDKPAIVSLLLASGADPNADIGGGTTAFLFLAATGSAEVLDALIDAGANLHAKSADGRDALDHAKSNGQRARRLLKQRMGIPSNAIDLLYEELKDLPRLAKQPGFAATAARVGERLNRKPAPWRRRKGVLYFHDVAVVKHLEPHFGKLAEPAGRGERIFSLLAKLQDEALSEGFTLVYVDSIPQDGRLPLILLPTANKYAALLASGTNGINRGHDTEAVISWLMAMETENPFVLAGCGHDFLDGRFVSGVQNAERLAERMIGFCPDIVAQATASLSRRSRPDQIAALAQQLSESGWFGFWWD